MGAACEGVTFGNYNGDRCYCRKNIDLGACNTDGDWQTCTEPITTTTTTTTTIKACSDYTTQDTCPTTSCTWIGSTCQVKVLECYNKNCHAGAGAEDCQFDGALWVLGKTLDECKALCAETAACEGVTLGNYNGDHCYCR